MATKFTATFSDGQIAKRSTERGEYTHAWRVRYESGHGEGWPKWEQVGFSASEELARKAAKGWQAKDKTAEREVVPVLRIHP